MTRFTARFGAAASVFVSLVGAAGLNGGVARADDEQSKALATDLFDRGVKLMTANKCDEGAPTAATRPACEESLDLFVKAYKTWPAALGALRNSAFVAKGLGRVALAHRNFMEVARRAPLDPSPGRKKWGEPAAKEATLLEPRIPHVTITASEVPADLQMSLDGEPIDVTLLKTRLPLDPGSHVIVAAAKDFDRLEVRVSVAERDDQKVRLELKRHPGAVAAVGPRTDATPPPPASDVAPPPQKPSHVVPIVMLAAGGAIAVTGLVFGELAQKARNDGCNNATHVCTGDSLSTAKSRATISTVLTIGGGVVAAAGAAVWIIRDAGHHDTAIAPVVTPTGAFVSVERALF